MQINIPFSIAKKNRVLGDLFQDGILNKFPIGRLAIKTAQRGNKKHDFFFFFKLNKVIQIKSITNSNKLLEIKYVRTLCYRNMLAPIENLFAKLTEKTILLITKSPFVPWAGFMYEQRGRGLCYANKLKHTLPFRNDFKNIPVFYLYKLLFIASNKYWFLCVTPPLFWPQFSCARPFFLSFCLWEMLLLQHRRKYLYLNVFMKIRK